ncbi:hypothetical protein [Allocoleopsis franciscana]|uniref:Uncharacterized protein n=1 Tax=Allocoleopsis franciscana PCC 7113 TaxID=1173027 RepID=K9W6E7_9CYAN|nr:hypothetical protein [Allocoleopsis franciscana]AFZ15950.1 hypothetical protein Mic7113_0002 [Allocoleopsis franciscana PCC 7113]
MTTITGLRVELNQTFHQVSQSPRAILRIILCLILVNVWLCSPFTFSSFVCFILKAVENVEKPHNLILNQSFVDFQIVEKLWKSKLVFPQSIYTYSEIFHDFSPSI